MLSNLPKNNVINDRILCSWIRCKRKAWLDRNEKSELKAWTSHRALQLDHQYKSLSAFTKNTPNRGLKACEEGSDAVVGLRINGISPLGVPLEAHPPLLIKVKGKSFWGNFSYIPVVARQGRRITREHFLSLAFYGYLLSKLQNEEVNYGLAVSIGIKGLEVQKIKLTKSIKYDLLEVLKKLNSALYLQHIPNLTSDRKKCTLCSWRRLCDESAYKEKDLSEVSGIGSKRKNILQAIGINNINELASSNVKDLTKKLNQYGDNHENIAENLINQAKVQNNSSPQKLNKLIIFPELESAKGVLIYDIESDPDASHDFLHGFVSMKRRINGEWNIEDAKYEPILNLENKDKTIWRKIKSKINANEDWPIIHYGETEFLSIIKLAKKNGASNDELNRIRNNFIDVHARLKSGWLLPVKSYSLKEVAKWINFKWSKRNTDGPKALLWWRQWIASKKSKDNLLKWILEYNQDDCIATWKITEWIMRRN